MRNTIICAAFNNYELTRSTFESCLASARQTSHFILVNNGSTDDTQEWVNHVAGKVIDKGETTTRLLLSEYRGVVNLTLVNNETNEGCGIGRNIGARLVGNSEYITFVDNDIVLTQEWDTEMIKFMDEHPEVGICGPMTNFAGTPQLLDKNRYKLPQTIDEVEPFANEFRVKNRQKWAQVPNGFVIIGFCMMIRKSCFDQLRNPDGGIFDEKFKYYGKEDNDLCRRATRLGWKLAYFGGCYVHHWGSKSLDALAAAGIDWGAEWRKNDRVFEEKWS